MRAPLITKFLPLFTCGVLALGLLTSCTDADKATTTTSTTKAASNASKQEESRSSSGSAKVGSLAELMLTDALEDFTREPDDSMFAGPVDKSGAIENDPREEAERELEDAGFSRGHIRHWTNDDGDELVIYLYEFETDAGADRYKDHLHAYYLDPPPEDLWEDEQTGAYDIPAIPTALGAFDTDGDFYSALVMASNGKYSVFVDMTVYDVDEAERAKAHAVEAARKQMDRLRFDFA